MQQDELIQSIEQALAIQDIPEITQTLLNLAEFMEHCEKVHVNYLEQKNYENNLDLSSFV